MVPYAAYDSHKITIDTASLSVNDKATPALLSPLPVEPITETLPAPTDIVKPTDKYDRFLHIVPLKSRKRASLLLDMLFQTGVTINKDMEVVFSGQPVRHSNILSLLRDAFLPKSVHHPQGMEKFYKYLRTIHIPVELIVNRDRRAFITGKLIKKVKAKSHRTGKKPHTPLKTKTIGKTKPILKNMLKSRKSETVRKWRST